MTTTFRSGVRVSRLVSTDMLHIIIKDYDKLKQVLEDLSIMEKVYQHFLFGDVVSAKVRCYEHPDGVVIHGKPVRYWVYVDLRSIDGLTNQVALWKILKVATQHPTAFDAIIKHIEIGGYE